MSEQFVQWILAGVGAAGVAGIAALWKQLRDSAKEATDRHERRTDQFILLQKDSIESRAKVAQVLEKLADKVDEIPCHAASKFNGPNGR